MRIDSATDRILNDARVALIRSGGASLRRLVLFGSQARGEATPDSDVDLLAILETTERITVEAMRAALYEVMYDHDFARLVSLHIAGAREFEDRLAKGYSFVQNVVEEGIVLWEVIDTEP